MAQPGRNAEELFLERSFQLKWRIGARTAFLIKKLASGFDAAITLEGAGTNLHVQDSNNPQMMMLLGPTAGGQVRVRTSGPDAATAMRAFIGFFTRGPWQERCLRHNCPSTPVFLGSDKNMWSYGCSEGHFWAYMGEKRTQLWVGLEPWASRTDAVSLS